MVEAVGSCFSAWLKHRGGLGSGEVIRGVEQVLRVLAVDGTRLFAQWRSAGSSAGHIAEERGTILGWRRQHNGRGAYDYFAHPEGFKELTKGFNARQVADALMEMGVLVPGTDGGPSCVVKLPGVGSKRVYLLRPDAVEGSEVAA